MYDNCKDKNIYTLQSSGHSLVCLIWLYMTHNWRVFLRNACFHLVSGQTHLIHMEQVTTNFEGLLKGQCPAMDACYRSIIKSLGRSASVM